MPKPERLTVLLLPAVLAACAAPDHAQSPAGGDSPPAAAAGPATTAADDRDGSDALAAAHLRARGNEPFWAIDIEGDTLHYVTPEMPDGRTLVAQRMAHARGVAFSGDDDGRPFNLDVTRTACTDSMSGERFEFTATWDYDGRRMEGCADRER